MLAGCGSVRESSAYSLGLFGGHDLPCKAHASFGCFLCTLEGHLTGFMHSGSDPVTGAPQSNQVA